MQCTRRVTGVCEKCHNRVNMLHRPGERAQGRVVGCWVGALCVYRERWRWRSWLSLKETIMTHLGMPVSPRVCQETRAVQNQERPRDKRSNSSKLYRQGENVSDATLGSDHAGRARLSFKLAPQP